MTARPVVSVIIPAYNAQGFLNDAVESATSQTYPELDIIIVDDGSTDGTGDAADSLARGDARVRVIHQPNAGLAAARNTALRTVRGDFVCFLDADDAFLPEKVEKQTDFLRANPEIGLVYSDLYLGDAQLGARQLRRTGTPPLSFPDLFVLRNWFQPIVPMLTAALVRRVGFFDESLAAAEDWDYWIRCAAETQFGYLPEPVAVYRRHPTQMSRQSERMSRAQNQLIAKHYAHSAVSHRRARAARHLESAKSSKRQPLLMVRELARFARAVPGWRDAALLFRVVE